MLKWSLRGYASIAKTEKLTECVNATDAKWKKWYYVNINIKERHTTLCNAKYNRGPKVDENKPSAEVKVYFEKMCFQSILKITNMFWILQPIVRESILQCCCYYWNIKPLTARSWWSTWFLHFNNFTNRWRSAFM